MSLSNLEMAVINGMARAFYVSAWADLQEQRSENYPGQEYMDDAPDTPEDVTLFAAHYAGAFAQANRTTGYASLITLLYAAAKADGIDTDKEDEDGKRFWEQPVNRFNSYAQEFGHYVAMQALGHGVGWFDDHEKFPLEIPHTEFYLDEFLDAIPEDED